MGGEPPGLGHGIQGGSGGLAHRFRPRRTKGDPGACPPGLGHSVQGGGPGGLPLGLGHGVQGGSGGLAPRFRPQRLELTHFVTGSVMFFMFFHAFHNLYTPPKKPFLPTGPASLLVVFRGFPPHIIDTRAQNRVFCSDFDGFFL